MSEYQEFTGKSVEEAIKSACDAFGVGLADLDFEILTPGSRGVLGMGAEPARIVAAPAQRPRRLRPQARGRRGDAAAAAGAPRGPAVRARRPRRDRGPRRDDRGGYRGPPPRTAPTAARGRDDRPAGAAPRPTDRGGYRGAPTTAAPRRDDRPRPRRRGPRAAAPSCRRPRSPQVTTARGSLAMERAELEAAEATPETLAAGKEILETLMGHLGFEGIAVEIREGETSRLNVVGDGADREALGSLIGRKGERLSALQHLVNLMLSRRTGQWTRVLVDVEDYRGRRERQLVDLATRAAERVERDRQDAPAGADARPRAPLDPPRAARQRLGLDPVDRRRAEPAGRRAAAKPVARLRRRE